MRSDLFAFVHGSENRKRIVGVLFEYPKRQWTCSVLEGLAKIPHATVFRTLTGLRDFGILKSYRAGKREVLYELADSPLAKELEKSLDIYSITAKRIANDFVRGIKHAGIRAAIMYGSSVKGAMSPASDIDILIILQKHDEGEERKILDDAGELSSKINKTISVAIMDRKEILRERDSPFLKSVKSNMEVLYGEKPF
ncbi:nucleotidyltransferase domain-containing protein [Candidatus Woesearchaeota archaeon]|nr:nucleotidyltransferase domain-containing protein [Candidatus Woesearchaeota archaeon]